MKSDREILKDAVKIIHGIDLNTYEAFMLEKEYKKSKQKEKSK